MPDSRACVTTTPTGWSESLCLFWNIQKESLVFITTNEICPIECSKPCATCHFSKLTSPGWSRAHAENQQHSLPRGGRLHRDWNLNFANSIPYMPRWYIHDLWAPSLVISPAYCIECAPPKIIKPQNSSSMTRLFVLQVLKSKCMWIPATNNLQCGTASCAATFSTGTTSCIFTTIYTQLTLGDKQFYSYAPALTAENGGLSLLLSWKILVFNWIVPCLRHIFERSVFLWTISACTTSLGSPDTVLYITHLGRARRSLIEPHTVRRIWTC